MACCADLDAELKHVGNFIYSFPNISLVIGELPDLHRFGHLGHQSRKSSYIHHQQMFWAIDSPARLPFPQREESSSYCTSYIVEVPLTTASCPSSRNH